jgi:predicted DNA-binding transcriptional regulator AlpA
VTDDEYLENEDNLCKAFGISRQTGRRLFKEGKWPRRTWISARRWGYRIEDINRWLAEQERSGTLCHLLGDEQ